MKKAFFWVLKLSIVVSLSFALGRFYSRQHESPVHSVNDELNNGFRPSNYSAHNRSFVIFVCGFNNGAFLEKTLRSVFAQVYENYRLIYIDDASTDGSFELARDCINQSQFSSRALFVHNEQKLGLLANLVRAVQICKDQEILVMLGGHDWLAHEWILQRLNHYYADPDLWLTYGQYCEFPTYQMGSVRNFQQSEFKMLRQTPLIANHLPTFYAALFKRIKESDFLFQGTFLSEAGELAVLLPMLEMGQNHFQFIPETLYISNSKAFRQENSDNQVRCEHYIRSLKPYLPLTVLNIEPSEDFAQNQEDGS